MAETLKYRFPNQAIVEKTGAFRPLQTNEVPNGFIVSDFLFDNISIFDENAIAPVESRAESPMVIAHSDYLKDATKMVQQLKESGGKAILSRIKKVTISETPTSIFDALCEAYPTAFVYLIESERFGMWIGASPEILLTREGERVRTMALAGTRRTDETLDWTEKEFEEHAFVADFIEETTRAFGVAAIERGALETVQSGPVKHLLTKFAFEFPVKEEWNWVREIHPTPAVSGWPRAASLELIDALEPHKRSLYTGVIGAIGAETALYVNLRCAQIIDNEMFLYLGGGFTKDSVPQDEWQETENKAKTLLNVLKKQ